MSFYFTFICRWRKLVVVHDIVKNTRLRISPSIYSPADTIAHNNPHTMGRLTVATNAITA